MDLHIIHEDRDILVVEKPAGLITSSGPRDRRPTLLAAVWDYVSHKYPKARVGLIHRLDRDAAGLLVFSKSHLAYRALKSQFFHHTVTRSYLALVQGIPNPPSGTLRSRLEERADGTVYSTPNPHRGQLAILEYKTIKKAKPRALIQLNLHTGRKHQVRVQLADRGTPIVGDEVYGKPDPAGLHLIALELAFDHPRTNKRCTYRLSPPPWLG